MEGQGLNAEGKTYFYRFVVKGKTYCVITTEPDEQKALNELIASL